MASRFVTNRMTDAEMVVAHNQPFVPRKQLFQILWKGAWLVLLSVALCLGGGFIYISKSTPIYGASSRLLVEQSGPVIIKDTVASSEESTAYLATQCELLKSSPILTPVAELPEIRRMKTFAGVDNPLGVLKMSLSATLTKPEELINVSFESPYPTEASDVVNAVVESYRTYYADRKRATAVEVLRILQKEKKDRDVDLEVATKDILAFKEANPNLSYSSEKGNIIIEQLAKLSEALTTAHLDSLEAKGNYEAANSIANDPNKIEEWIRLQRGASTDQGLRNELQQYEAELATLKLTLLPSHANIKSLQTRIDGLKQTLVEESRQSVQGYIGAIGQRYQMAKQREDDLQRSFNEQQTKALSLNSESARLGAKESEYKRLERLCDMLDSRMKEVKVTGDVGSLNISVLEYAKPELAPIKPKPTTIMFEALVLGLALGGGMAWLRDWMDHRVCSAEEIQQMLGLNLIGVLPHIPGKETVSVRGQKVQLDPMSEVAEAYRTIRTAVYFGAPEGKTKTLLLTSPSPGDGKTTTASNLAIAMAQAGQSVLLLDADFRRPSQHKVFEVDDSIGMTSVVAGKASLAEAVKPTNTPGLSLLPCGPLPKNPSEILNSRTFAQMIEQLEDRFDHLVIDSPPLMPVADARILGALCDLTIIVLRAEKSTRKVSIHAKESLAAVGSRILGVVVNDVPRGRNEYGAYGGYSYGRYGNTKSQRKALEGQTNGVQLPAAASE